MDFDFPASFRFADSHEYAFLEGDLIRVGISAFAVDQLGDIVFVDLPDEGTTLKKGTTFGSVESVKAVEDIYAPVTGQVLQVNANVLDNPEALQNDPHGSGWLMVLKPANLSELDDLMDSLTYSNKIAPK